MHVQDFQPINDDILIRLKKEREVTGSVIEFRENTDEKQIQYFTVLAVGPDVRGIHTGDTVIVPWARVTPPFKIHDNSGLISVGVTSEKEVLGVIEE